MVDYDAWANTLVFSSLREQGDAGPDARRLFNHILGSQLVWLARIEATPPGPIWPEWSLEQCGRHVRELPDRWRRRIVETTDPNTAVMYRNSKGEEFTTAVGDILLHVFTHSHYHRGQIASRLRAVGLTPGLTDYIQFARTRR
jgi:uncharacterized damage-inducible protein DinB